MSKHYGNSHHVPITGGSNAGNAVQGHHVTPPAWFNPNTYLHHKLSSMESGWNYNSLAQAMQNAGYSLDAQGLYRHYSDHGRNEGVSPIEHFNTSEYLHNKAAQFYQTQNITEAQVDTVAQLIADAGMTPWEHYQRHGWREGVNSSDTFDTQQYFQDKLAQMGGSWTIEKLYQAFSAAGLTPVEHLQLHGKSEGLHAKPVVGVASTQNASLRDALIAADEQPVSEDTQPEDAFGEADLMAFISTLSESAINEDEANLLANDITVVPLSHPEQNHIFTLEEFFQQFSDSLGFDSGEAGTQEIVALQDDNAYTFFQISRENEEAQQPEVTIIGAFILDDAVTEAF